MNKYQEAFNRVKEYLIYTGRNNDISFDEIRDLQELIDNYSKLHKIHKLTLSKNFQLDKALDKVCNAAPNLQWDGCYSCPCCLEKCIKSDSNKNGCDAKDWKEWAMKDE